MAKGNGKGKGKGKGKRKTAHQLMMSKSANQIGRQLANTPHTFMRYASSDATIVSNYLSQTLGGFAFDLGKVQNNSEFTALYDQYRILKVYMDFRANAIEHVNQLVGSTVPNDFRIPLFYTRVDIDDASFPSAVSELKQSNDCYVRKTTKDFSISIVPHVANTIYRTGVTSAYGPAPAGTWLDVAVTDIPHYGLKYAMESTGGTDNSVQFQYKVSIRYLLQFKGVR